VSNVGRRAAGCSIYDAGARLDKAGSVRDRISVTIDRHLVSVDALLRRLGAKLTVWEVQALYMGAMTSTNLRLGFHHLFPHLFGDDPVLGESLDDANANLQVLGGFWNALVSEREAGRPIPLSRVPQSKPTTIAEVRELAHRRRQEILWLVRGIDAGGDDPIEFGPEGERLFGGLGEASGFCEATLEILDRKHDHTDAELEGARAGLDQLTGAVERLIADLMSLGADVRAEAIREHERRAPNRRSTKVGRNDSCPCGSGRKWKRCCGAPQRQH
jgi:hypothetical protein